MIFSEYFNEWLYAQDGYYANFKDIGKEGDFYTAVSTSKFFGGAIAKHIIEVIDGGFLSSNATILEIGAHKGYLLADIIEFINTLRPQLLITLKFAILERYAPLRQIQKKYFNECFGDVINLIQYPSLDDICIDEAFVISNEIFDAFSCELVMSQDNKLVMAKVDEQHKISWVDATISICDICATHHISKGEVIDIGNFANKLKSNIKKMEFMSFDYGEIYPRNDFSIRIYQDHKVYPFFEDGLKFEQLFKKSDITYDVNFAVVQKTFEDAGFVLVDYKTQLKALVDMGILDLLQMVLDNAKMDVYLRELNKVKTLITPTLMGERFKMIVFRA